MQNADSSLGGIGMENVKNDPVPVKNNTDLSTDQTIKEADVDPDNVDTAGGVSVIAAENDPSALVDKEPVPINKNIAVVAKNEMSASSCSASKSAGKGVHLPLSNGESHDT